MEQLAELENKLAVAVNIIKFDIIHYKYTDIATGQFIEQCRLRGMTDRQIINKFNFLKKEYCKYQKAFERYFFQKIKNREGEI